MIHMVMTVIRHARSTGVSGASQAAVRLDYLLELERALNPEDRALILTREFARLAVEVLAPSPVDRGAWPSPSQLGHLQSAIMVLQRTAGDPILGLPCDTIEVADARTVSLVKAIEDLRGYAHALVVMQSVSELDLEPLRLLVGRRAQLNRRCEDVIQRLTHTARVPGDTPGT